MPKRDFVRETVPCDVIFSELKGYSLIAAEIVPALEGKMRCSFQKQSNSVMGELLFKADFFASLSIWRF